MQAKKAESAWFSSPVRAFLAVFFVINGFYVVKYGVRAGVHPLVGVPAYAVFMLAHCAAAYAVALGLKRASRPYSWLAILVVAYAACASAVYSRIDPMGITLDRWSALQNFLDALFSGRFPWSVPSHMGNNISGFPGLFLLALPFYLLGDVGLMQFFALLALVLLAVVRFKDASRPAFLFILLVSTPLFSYQIFCRSDLFGNMVAVAWLLHLGERAGAASGFKIVLWGLAWGLMLSTRAIVVVPLLVAAFPLLRGRGPWSHAAFGLSVTVAFFATFLPFYLWDKAMFLAHNPWHVQAGYASRPVLAAILLFTAWLGWKHRASPHLFRDAGWVLTAIVFLSWVLRSIDLGWAEAFWRHAFDVTYFTLGIPFLLLAVGESLPASAGKHRR